MRTELLINELSTVLLGQIARAKEIGHLPSELLLRRPAPDHWNVLEVFEHLNLSSGIYVRGLRQVFDREAASYPANSEFKPGLLGNYFTNAMCPKPDGRIQWKMRTMKFLDPARQHGASSTSITSFIRLCEQCLDLLERARTTDLNGMKVISSLGTIIRFKAGDAFRFPVAHQERHFLQIERLVR